MCVETTQELEGLLRIGRVVSETLQLMKANLQPGITTGELDAIADAYLKRFGARPAPRITYGYPAIACISVNNEVAHGIPGKRKIRQGDLVKLDVSAELNGYFADAAITVPVPPISDQAQRLMDCAYATMQAAIAAAKANTPLHQVGQAAENTARRCGYKVIRDLPGHGIGRRLHEEPSVPSYYNKRDRRKLKNGEVITVEPHISSGGHRITEGADGWTLRTADGSLAANFEHTIVVTHDAPILITAM